ncbi:MAG: PD-(D/E)XK nuclease family protein [Planctomycetia bacterium]
MPDVTSTRHEPAGRALPGPGRLRLVTGGPGSGKSRLALELVKQHATHEAQRGRAATDPGAALLVLPTYGEAQHALRSALVHWEARALWDAPFVTFTSVGERFLPGWAVRSLPSAEERDRLMGLALEQAGGAALAAGSAHRGLRARLLRLLKDVKQGTQPLEQALAALEAGAEGLAPGPAARARACVKVARRYGQQLAAGGLEAHEDALQRLRRALDERVPERLPRLVAVDGFDDMTPVEVQVLLRLSTLVQQAGGEVLVTLPWDGAREELFASAGRLRTRLLGAGFAEERLAGFRRAPGGALERLAGAWEHPQAGTLEPLPAAPEVELLEALDAAHEDEVVAHCVRRLLDEAGGEGAPVRGARDILVVLPALEARGPGLAQALERLEVPVHLEGARLLQAEPLVRALAPLLGVLGGALEAGEVSGARVLDTLRYVALGSDPALLADVDAHDLRWREAGFPGDWAGLCEQSSGRVRAALEAWQAAREQVEASGSTREAPAVVQALLDALSGCVPLPSPGGLDAQGRRLDPARDRAVLAAAQARARVAALLRERVEVAVRAGAPCDGPRAARDLAEALERASSSTPERRLDVVHLLDPERARGWEARVVFVVGLEERSLPRRVGDDPLLADEERARLERAGLSLPRQAEHEARERRRVLAVLTRASRRLVLSRPCLTAEGDTLPPSRVLARVQALLHLAPAALGPRAAPGAPALEDCRSQAELACHAAARLARATGGEAALAGALLSALDPALPARAARWRRGAADVLAPEDLARLAGSVARTSPTLLRELLACPQRHFLQRVLGLRSDDLRVSGPLFGARELGQLVHAALRLALAEPATAPAEVAQRVLEGQGAAVADRALVRARLQRMVTLLRGREAGIDSPFVAGAGGLELALGPGGSGVELGPPGQRFLLTGSIDRVDLCGREAVVLDYKQGAGGVEGGFKGSRDGHDPQLALYARALEQGQGLVVVGLEWAGSGVRLRRALHDAPRADELAARAEGPAPEVLEHEAFRALLATAEAQAADAVARVRGGDTRLAPRERRTTCAACAVRALCRPHPSVSGADDDEEGEGGDGGTAGDEA